MSCQFSHRPSGSPTALTVGRSQWSNPNDSIYNYFAAKLRRPLRCDTSRAIKAPAYNKHAGLAVTTLAGWSAGRLGPIYFLAQASTEQQRRINYILLIDPGTYGELSGCDSKVGAGMLLAGWLVLNPSSRLVILAGDLTADSERPVNGYAHAGIQNVYLEEIRRAKKVGLDMSRVLICNYTVPGTLKHSHEVMFQGGNKYIQEPPLTSCPNISGAKRGVGWHP